MQCFDDGSTARIESVQLYGRESGKAGHAWQMEKAENVIIHLDYKHSGLGSNSCGEEQIERAKVKRQDFSMAFTLQMIEAGTEKETAKKKYLD